MTVRQPSGPTARERRQKAEKRGIMAEHVVAIALRLKGYRILARRYRTPVGEIDLVVRRGRLVAFVEVKARGDIDTAAEAVTPRTRRRVIQAARLYMQKNPHLDACDQRFDVALVRPRRWPVHVPSAFFADD
ncbi:hypothetical protein HDIA_0085 [Hartmannibacter diazotrophicus]|uniref:UPF0102 protein HDIA_0085 n=1 Tax=Hartmannibacter diazotrophicus TaxID=1482074 RepID=A0A2C9D053_9HYPH|nr:YraN family protein [Hartmannibacter diazotrophicus]SON53626.1 hypothetical protein HDIA_0085 [Hartmannibacter diazotrophicus]